MRKFRCERWLVFACFLTACNAGARYSDRTDGTVTVGTAEGELENGVQNFAIDEALYVHFSRAILFRSLTSTSAFIVEDPGNFLAVLSGTNFNSNLCNPTNQVESSLGYTDRTLIVAPLEDLDCGTRYALCLTTDLLIEEDLPYSGSTFYFDTQECIPALANANPVVGLTGQAITAVDFSNAGGAVDSCEVSPSLPAGLSLSVSGGSCRISGTPTASTAQATYTVTGTNLSGSDDATIVIEVLYYPPTEPSGLTFVSSTDSAIALSWTSGGGTTSGFYIKYAAGSSAPANCSSPQVTLANVTSTTVTGLSAGTEYSFRLCSINANSTPDVSAGITLTSRWTLASNIAFSTTTQSATALTLNWSAASGAATYAVKRAVGLTAPADCSSPDYTTAGTSQAYAGLTQGTAYSFRICSINSNSDVSPGTTTTAYTLADNIVLDTPTILTNRIILSWNFSTGASSYRTVRAAGATAPANCNSGTLVQASGSPVVNDTPLSIGTQYSYRICALNPNGNQSSGTTTTVWTEASDPAIGSVTSDESSVTLNWNAATGAASYRIAQAAGATPPTDCTTAVATPAGTSATISPLSGGTQYSFLVCTVNGGGSSSSGSAVSKWTLPNNPTGLGGSTATTTSIDLSWSAGSGSNNGFYIKYQSGASAPASCSSPNTTTASGVTTANISGLTPGQYSFRVCQINGNSPVDVSSGTTLTYWTRPSDPATFTISAASTSQLNLSWTAGAGSNNGWRIKRASGETAPANCSSPDFTLGSGTLSMNDTGLTAGQYSYRICAINGNTTPDSSAGLDESWWTHPEDPINFAVDSVTSSSINVSWTGVGSVYRYRMRRSPASDGPGAPADCSGSLDGVALPNDTTYQFLGLNASTAYNIRICSANDNPTPDVSTGVLITNVTTAAMLMGASSFNAFGAESEGGETDRLRLSHDESELLVASSDETFFARFDRDLKTGTLQFKSFERFNSETQAIADLGRFFSWSQQEKVLRARASEPDELLISQNLNRGDGEYLIGLNENRQGVTALKLKQANQWKLADRWIPEHEYLNVPGFSRGLRQTQDIKITRDRKFVYVLGENGGAISTFKVMPDAESANSEREGGSKEDQ